MGMYHTFYLEGKIGGKWKCVCPQYKGRDGAELFHHIICGKGFLHEICDELCERGVDASADVADGSEYTSYYLFDAQKAKKILAVRSNENRGYVEKSNMDKYKIDTDYGIYEWLSVEAFRALDSESQKAYVYFEWTNRRDFLDTLREIFIISNKFKEMYESRNPEQPSDYRIVLKVS